MRFWRSSKSRLTGINVGVPPFSIGATWDKETDEREARARGERADAFAELWGIVQDAHIGIRNDFDRVEELTEVHRQLNILGRGHYPGAGADTDGPGQPPGGLPQAPSSGSIGSLAVPR